MTDESMDGQIDGWQKKRIQKGKKVDGQSRVTADRNEDDERPTDGGNDERTTVAGQRGGNEGGDGRGRWSKVAKLRSPSSSLHSVSLKCGCSTSVVLRCHCSRQD